MRYVYSWRFSRLLHALSRKARKLSWRSCFGSLPAESGYSGCTKEIRSGWEQRPSQAGSLPDPTLSMGWNSNGNPLPGAGLGTDPTSNLGLSITQEIQPGNSGCAASPQKTLRPSLRNCNCGIDRYGPK